MKYILFFLSISLYSYSQDLDLYTRHQDDKVNMPFLHESMALKEFQLLSRDIRMMDMLYAVVVPGYIHFKAQEKTKGYVLLGLRASAYLGLTAVYIASKSRGDTFWGGITGSNVEEEKIQVTGQWSITTSDIVETTSIIIIISTYLYDWIHGKAQLERKQELIRYKYSLKLKLEQINYRNNTSFNYAPGLSLIYHF